MGWLAEWSLILAGSVVMVLIVGRVADAIEARCWGAHRLGVRCGRCGKARYRVDAPAGVVSDPQYPDWD